MRSGCTSTTRCDRFAAHRIACARISPRRCFSRHPTNTTAASSYIQDTYGAHSVKLPAGDLILYPSSSLHKVQPVTRGERIASFFWVQSMVRDDADRALLYDLDTAIQRLVATTPDHPAVVQLTGVYHNLLRRWSEL